MRYIIASYRKSESAYGTFLRTGHWPEPVETKHNPNHDPHDGRFTFKAGGSGPAPGARSTPKPHAPPDREVYTVKNGDTLHDIAATRVGLSAQDVAKLNGLSVDQRIQPGQQLVLPTQASLDRAKQGFDTATALSLYAQEHGGALPPDVAHPPSAAEQLVGPGARKVTANGYDYVLDADGRTRMVSGTVHQNPSQTRSQTAQREAGGPDRLPSDEGGHYIARRFDGPTDAFNHFAQDANFNRRGYRKLENRWSDAIKRGEKVHVTIIPAYLGGSRRPYSIGVSYTIGGHTINRDFPNGQ